MKNLLFLNNKTIETFNFGEKITNPDEHPGEELCVLFLDATGVLYIWGKMMINFIFLSVNHKE